jgi:hypothetical protein
MYFINEWHKTNYNHMVNMVFLNSKNDPEYHVIAYILSLPEIYSRCINDPMLFEFPFFMDC